MKNLINTFLLLVKPKIEKLVILRGKQSNHKAELAKRGETQFNASLHLKQNPEAAKNRLLQLKPTSTTRKPPKIKIIRLGPNFKTDTNISYNLPEDVKQFLAHINVGNKEDENDEQEQEVDNGESSTQQPDAGFEPTTKKPKVVLVPRKTEHVGESKESGVVRLAQEKAKKRIIVKKIIHTNKSLEKASNEGRDLRKTTKFLKSQETQASSAESQMNESHATLPNDQDGEGEFVIFISSI